MLPVMGRHIAFLVFTGPAMTQTWPAFDWADPLLLETSLCEDEKLVCAIPRAASPNHA